MTYSPTTWVDETGVGDGTVVTAARMNNIEAGLVAAPGGTPINTIGSISRIAGQVGSGGTVAAGTGFSVTRINTGAYVVTFTTAFAATPMVIVSGFNNSALTVDVISANANSCQISTTASSTGTAVDAAFNFEATDFTTSQLGVSGYARTSYVHTSASIALNASDSSTMAVVAGWRALKASTNRPARVRVYATSAQRTADAARAIGTDPTGNHGLLFELVTTAAQLSYTLSPAVDFSSDDGTSNFYAAVTNLDTTTGTVVTTYSYIRTE